MKIDSKTGLTASDVRRELNYDPETGEFTRKTSFFKTRIGEKAGSVSKSNGYVVIAVCGVQYLAHRLAWLYVHGAWPSKYIDHINGIKTDNRLCNLRDADNGENMQNQRRARRNNKTGMLGVRRNKTSGNYVASITVNGRVVNIGSFKTAEEAHEAYRHAKRDTHTHGMLVPRTTEPPNKLKKRKSSTGHTGVEFRSGRYRAFFHADRRTKINVGSFHTAEDAIEARRVAMEMGAEAWIEFSSGQAASKTNSTRGSKSGFVGVHKVSGKDWYEAYFDHDGKRYFVGGFDTAEAASVARQKAKADHYSRKMDGKQP